MSSFVKNLIALLIGPPLLLGVLSLLAGPSAPGPFGTKVSFLQIALLWVVCSGGVILVPFFVCGWLVGLLVVFAVDLVRVGWSAPAAPAKQDPVALLMGYIRRAWDQGVPAPEVEGIMVRNGWSRAEIEEAYRRLRGS